jgi:hypothetical protein
MSPAMTKHTSHHRATRAGLFALCATSLLGGLAPAHAEDEGTPLVIDPSGATPIRRAGTTPAATPAPTKAAPDIRVITLGPDGKVATDTAATDKPKVYYGGSDSGGYYDDGSSSGGMHLGLTPELHVVRSGDTLWDISWYYFGDPWQWPKVWSYNAQITNPHWIYPGDLVRLLPKGVYVAPTTDDGGTTSTTDLPSPTKRSSLSLRDVAFVDKESLDEATTIDGSPEEKQLLATGDSVYLAYPGDKAPEVGARLSIYREERKVAHDGKPVGSYVEILGELEVVSVKKDKRPRGVIIDARHEIERGFKVGPLVTQLETLPPVAPEVSAQGTIIAMLTKDSLIGEGEVVFIDLGKDSGLKVGNRMRVVRRGDAAPQRGDITKTGQDDRRYEARALGEVSIVDVGENQSIGVVSLSIREMGVGDLVVMQKPEDEVAADDPEAPPAP